MALEIWTATSRPNIIDVSWPEPNDPLNQGDDHLRLIKTCLKNFYNDVWNTAGGRVKVTAIPPAVKNASAGSGFGGFRYTTVNSSGVVTLNLFTS